MREAKIKAKPEKNPPIISLKVIQEFERNNSGCSKKRKKIELKVGKTNLFSTNT
jgi:hypothetical protein